MAQPSSSKLTLALKLLLGIGIVVILAIVARQLNLQQPLQNALIWVKNLGSVGAIAFMALYILATILLIPASLLTLGGGAIFGVVLGSVYIFAAATMGAIASFLIGRYLARGWVEMQIAGNTRFQAIDNAIAREGLKIVILTRLSPVFPFSLLNYALSITQVSFKDYLLGFIGMIPGTVMFVYIGSLVGSLATIDAAQSANPHVQTIQQGIRIFGFIVAAAVTVYVTRIAKRALEESYEV